MSTLQEKEVVLKFKVAGYDLDDIDFTHLHNSMMIHATDLVSLVAVVGNFTSEVNDKKVKS